MTGSVVPFDMSGQQQPLGERMQRARSILLHWPLYRSMSPHEIGMRIDVPLYLHHAAILPGEIFVSWSFLEKHDGSFVRMVEGAPPHYDDWSMDGPVLWLMDVAAVPERTGLEVGRAINAFFVDNGIVEVGQRAAFRRHRGARYGWASAQGDA